MNSPAERSDMPSQVENRVRTESGVSASSEGADTLHGEEALDVRARYFVRIGFQQQIVPMHSSLNQLGRGDAVICRTERGLEMGEVLACVDHRVEADQRNAVIVRRCSPEDQLLWKQLKSLGSVANEACQEYLRTTGSVDVLVEVEPLLDGKTLYFHFLGDPSPETEAQVQTLAEVYQQSVANSPFAQTLEKGCGPDCGTKSKGGCGTADGCAVCSVMSRCKTNAR